MKKIRIKKPDVKAGIHKLKTMRWKDVKAGCKNFGKWRKATSAEAILDKGYDQAVEETSDKMLQDIQGNVRNGIIAPGKWNSAQTFGDPETFRANIANQGWYVYSMPIAEQSQSEREARIAPYIQGACKRAGAIHEADVLVVVEE